MATSPSSPFRWQSFFHRSIEPLFLLSRHRRLLFVNRAWEELTGLPANQVKGLICTPRATSEPGPWSALAPLLCPPPEVLDGKPGRVRRLVSGSPGTHRWWDIEFFPLRDEQGILCVLGKVTVVGSDPAEPSKPMPEKLAALREQMATRHGFEQLASEVPSLRRVADQVYLASQNRASVLIVGESGAGKQWIARTIHHQGITRERTFASLNCAGLPPSSVSAILFGPGGFVGKAGMGTIYFKDPFHLPRDLQARVSDWLTLPRSARFASGSATEAPGLPSAPRVIAGCCTEPADAVQSGRLLEDLYCALAVQVIAVPPLRARKKDLPLLTDRLLARLNANSERRIEGLTPSAWDVFRVYDWPGNLRELHQVLAGARARSHGSQIDVPDLPAHLRRAILPGPPSSPSPAQPLPLDHLLEQVERRLIGLALRLAQGNKSRAAELLAIWRPRLHRRMEALGIPDS